MPERNRGHIWRGMRKDVKHSQDQRGTARDLRREATANLQKKRQSVSANECPEKEPKRGRRRSAGAGARAEEKNPLVLPNAM